MRSFLPMEKNKYKRPPSYAQDVWAFGCMMWELQNSQRMWRNAEKLEDITNPVLRGNMPGPNADGDWPADIVRLTTECWSPQPSSRPQFGEITRRVEKAYRELAAQEDSFANSAHNSTTSHSALGTLFGAAV